MEDFIFGTLATDEKRLARIKAQRSGLSHLNRISPRKPLPKEPVTVMATLGPGISADRLSCYYTTDGSEPQGERGRAIHGRAIALERVGVQWDTLLWGYVESWWGELPPQPEGTKVRYKIGAWSSRGGEEIFADNQAPVSAEATNFAYLVDRYAPPDWAREAIIYQIFLDRFYPGDGESFKSPATPRGFYGGTLRGVTQKLDYLSELGVTCLWLSPCFASPSHHGYDSTDWYTVEPRLGTNEDLRELVEAAHARDIRVLLDFVPNHVSNQHPFFQAAQADPNSPYRRWFVFTRWPNEYETFFGIKQLPKINNEYEPARRYVIDCACHYLTEYGVDGFRLDYANGPSHDFWVDFRQATKAARPDSFSFGEVVEAADVVRSYASCLDGCLDFLLLRALRRFFAFGSLDTRGFDVFLSRHYAYFRFKEGEFLLPNFLDNHDMNRFLWAAEGDKRRLKLAATCQFALPGPPIIYYGTEVGLSQVRDVRTPDGYGHPEESRLPMLWGDEQDKELLAHYKRLIAIRKAHPVLWQGEYVSLLAEGNILAFLRRSAEETLVVVLNNGEGVYPLDVPLEGHLPDGVILRDLIGGGEARVVGGRLRGPSLPPRTGAILSSSC